MSRSSKAKEFFKGRNQEFCREGAVLARDNARTHFNAAEMLKSGDYLGLALSHYILSIEESIKSHVLITSAIGAGVDPERLGEAFSDHRAKHLSAASFTLSSALLVPIAKKLAERNPEISDSPVNPSDALAIWGRGIDLEEMIVGLDLDWWQQANINKEVGFYVDVDYARQSWKSPKSVSDADVEKAHKIAEAVLSRVELLFSVPFGDLRNAFKDAESKSN